MKKKENKHCTWSQAGDKYDPYDYWSTSCGHEFTLTEGTPKDNEMKFCCFCGKKLVEEPWKEER